MLRLYCRNTALECEPEKQYVWYFGVLRELHCVCRALERDVLLLQCNQQKPVGASPVKA
jgi:hypothetical protein